MGARTTVKAPAIVGVIASRAELRVASRKENAPDLFELRLDGLVAVLDAAEHFAQASRLPLIITARHPAEGGWGNLNARSRRELLARFLPYASYVDIELRSFKSFTAIAKEAKRLIISTHEFSGTPSLKKMSASFEAAKSAGADIFKIATRTDTPVELSRLLQFASWASDLPVAAMGIGKLGLVARLLSAACDAPLIYGAMGAPRVDGQPTVAQLRSALRFLHAK